MEEQPGQMPPVTPPPPAYVPPAPPTEPQGGYAPQQPYTPAAPLTPPRKKKTWLWIVLALVVLGLLGCCVVVALLGGLAWLGGSSSPTGAVDAINQAALDGDSATFEKHFDVDSVTAAAYESMLEYLRGTEDFQTIVDELGEEEADRILREEALPEDTFTEEVSASFNVEDPDGGVPFPNYTVKSQSVNNTDAELTILTSDEQDGEVTYVLAFSKEDYNGETVWRLKEIKNIAELFGDEEL
jgi:hypothetical protein